MKKMISFLMLALSMLASCSKDDTASSSNTNTTAEILATAPVAKVENDASNTGVYKGVFVGSTGILSISIKNGDDKVTARLKVDGKAIVFTAAGEVIKGQVINALKFMSADGHSFKLTVAADGSSYSVSEIVVTGHPNAAIDLIKEKSNTQIKCYEGSYASNTRASNKGTFNMIFSDTKFKGLSRATEGQDTSYLSGQVSNGVVTGYASGDGYINGKIEGDNISGTWTNKDKTETGTWVGKRTL